MSPEEISAGLSVSVDLAHRLRLGILNKFIQPVWFIDLLESERILSGGFLSSTSELLIQSVVARNGVEAQTVNGNIPDVVNIWIEDAVNPRLDEEVRYHIINQFYVRLSDRIVTARLAQMFHHTV